MPRRMMILTVSFILVVALVISFGVVTAEPVAQDDVTGIVQGINAQLADMGLNVQIAQVDFFTIGQGRPSARILQQPFRWVPNDPNRLAQGDDITYIVTGSPPNGVSSADANAAIVRSMNTWNAERCLSSVDIVQRADPGGDITIFDFFIGAGAFGDPFAADIVSAGWFPPGPPWFGPNTLAFSVTFTFVDGNGNPLDSNGDNFVDTALNEVYYNAGFNWGVNADLPLIDIETVALHENGHSLGLGHFGPPPTAVMNPVYHGQVHEPDPTDHAGMCANYSRWPNR